MSTIGYSPWTDAANYGRGLGDTLGQILLQVPRLRAQQAQQGVEFQNEQKLFPGQLKLQQAQINSLQQRPEIEQLKLALQQAMANQRMESMGISDKLHQAQTDKLTNPQMQQKPLTPPNMMELDKGAQQMIGDKARSMTQGQPKAPINVDPKLVETVVGMMKNALQGGQSPTAAGMQGLQGVQMQPQLQTNMVPQQVPGSGGIMHLPQMLGGQGYQPQTNMVPQVSTNGYNMSMPMPQMGPLQPTVPVNQSQAQMPQQGQQQVLTPDLAAKFLQQAGGDKNVARQLARQAGYTF